MGRMSQYRSDPKKLEEGVWDEFGDPADPIRFKIAYLNHGLAEAVQALPPDQRQRAKNKRLSSKEWLDVYMEATSSHVLLDWENMQAEDEEGNPAVDDEGEPIMVPYSPEKAREILEDDNQGEFHEWLLERARSRERFRQEMLEDASGN